MSPDFEEKIKPFLTKNCLVCHNADNQTAGVRVDHLTGSMEENHLRMWEAVRHRIADGSMPPKGLPQPSSADREQTVSWIAKELDVARLRPAPKNGLVRRLTVAQYRNTLQELLGLDDHLTETLPPDAVSRDGFLNNQDTLHLNPLLIEAYLEVAGDALDRAIVDPRKKPTVQNFRMDLGADINKNPLPEKLILGANSLLLENSDFTVTELTPTKPFAFEPFRMQTKFRYIEGYQGNDTVRGWRDFDSIYHAVFACMRGSRGYPKGMPYTAVPGGLLLRPAIPNDELFEQDGTYGPKANFKISLRELPDHGRFRVTVMAAKYDDGLMLDAETEVRSEAAAVTVAKPEKEQTVTIPQAGVYQVDFHSGDRKVAPPAADSSRLANELALAWPPASGAGDAKLDGRAELTDSPVGRAVLIQGRDGGATIPASDAFKIGGDDFTVAAWIHPRQLRRGGIVVRGGADWTHGWYLDMLGNRGVLRLDTAGPDKTSNGTLTSPPGVLRAGEWQHVAAVVRRNNGRARLYVNGYLVATGNIGGADLDNPNLAVKIGMFTAFPAFPGEIADVRLYKRALDESELEALIEPGRQFAKAPPERPTELKLKLGDRLMNGMFQPAFAAVRLPAGAITVQASHSGVREIERMTFTPVAASSALGKEFAAFEKRVPKLGVHVGLRRDCGSTFAPVGEPQVVSKGQLTKFVYEGAIQNYPSPDVEKDNVNYLAGVREIAVRSEYTDGRDMPRLLIRSIEFEGPFYESWPPPSHRKIFGAAPAQGGQTAHARQVIRNFATRAYRRPATAEEQKSLFAVYEKAMASGRSFEDSIKDALQVALTSPQFLLITESSASPKAEPLDGYELASKLSYFLWNGPPDQTLLKLAAAGSLARQIDAQVDRMIADPRFERFTRQFVYQWLNLDKFDVVEPERKQFPKLSRDMKAHLRQEPIEFVQHLIRQNLPVRNLVDSDFVVADEAVADYYDFPSKTESGFDFVAIPHGRRELGGLLTQPAILAGLSDGRESNPIKRGAWMARKIVAEPPADPPPNVPAVKEDAAKTLRERLEQHRNQPGCRQCHTKIDPWGVALEEFDAGGRLKKEAADARSKLPDGTEVSGIESLKRYLAEDRADQLAFSVLKHLAIYGNGRSLTYGELHHLKQDAVKLRPAGYRMKDMIHYVVTSGMFLEK